MNKKLFYILLIVLTGYGLTMSVLTHTMGRENIFYFFNMGAQFVGMSIILVYSIFGSSNPNFVNVSLGYIFVMANLIFWSPIAFGISYCFSKEKKFLSRKLNTRNKILIISIVALVFIILPAFLFSGQSPHMPEITTIDDTQLFNSTKDISDLSLP